MDALGFCLLHLDYCAGINLHVNTRIYTIFEFMNFVLPSYQMSKVSYLDCILVVLHDADFFLKNYTLSHSCRLCNLYPMKIFGVSISFIHLIVLNDLAVLALKNSFLMTNCVVFNRIYFSVCHLVDFIFAKRLTKRLLESVPSIATIHLYLNSIIYVAYLYMYCFFTTRIWLPHVDMGAYFVNANATRPWVMCVYVACSHGCMNKWFYCEYLHLPSSWCCVCHWILFQIFFSAIIRFIYIFWKIYHLCNVQIFWRSILNVIMRASLLHAVCCYLIPDYYETVWAEFMIK